eukprot:CAMPEP_0206366408 /NCGR_PEP_ID=MMETSP0294-20121207/3438_1 /ASSEMBLY_ACC=CAM_ASM_000327 /TAXON_ID=39354 /ORGANISM="Heterosigma akashiwo, Strain CCMP2393" /LENGTH=373 /DNA_ID=CAMNT_0053812475 /DNA_START=230 /DNA_END=1352 /DNA_ORIENTATION=-
MKYLGVSSNNIVKLMSSMDISGPGSAQEKILRLERVEKFARLPVWPVWSGVLYFLLDRLGLKSLSCELEDRFGGRVCPMIMDPYETDPFILMVHHRHSFAFGDPVRYISRLLLPEGFPAHPHRGFETVTYVLKGSMVHRDSLGVKQPYGPGAAQWLTAGRGWGQEQFELYQIWVNLPSSQKMCDPKIQLLGQGGEKPIPESTLNGVKVRVIAGEALGVKSQVETYTDVAIIHATIDPSAEWIHKLPAGHVTCFAYLQSRGGGGRGGRRDGGGGAVAAGAPHCFLPGRGEQGRRCEAPAPRRAGRRARGGAAALGGAAAGGVVAQGSMVMNTERQVAEAYRDYQAGTFGPTWDEKLSDEDWLALVKKSQKAKNP